MESNKNHGYQCHHIVLTWEDWKKISQWKWIFKNIGINYGTYYIIFADIYIYLFFFGWIYSLNIFKQNHPKDFFENSAARCEALDSSELPCLGFWGLFWDQGLRWLIWCWLRCSFVWLICLIWSSTSQQGHFMGIGACGPWTTKTNGVFNQCFWFFLFPFFFWCWYIYLLSSALNILSSWSNLGLCR